eukprot:CAMPEP_0178960174 /NCGR_PEP_ID=MMETSP0789-20121207/12796_1 /TAXON_ID=3005 /ORGANISM="Rhizosolenia setigera, Strain CCMP 1694" /LENGTH=306 /DNA_ID=CAMNT_0020643451 /DNA_START=53 /DNA_END=973 /DNA_ORIENTATION=+
MTKAYSLIYYVSLLLAFNLNVARAFVSSQTPTSSKFLHISTSSRTNSNKNVFNKPLCSSSSKKNSKSSFLSAVKEDSTEKDQKEKELTEDMIIEMIEVSFVTGVMQLSQGFVDVIKLFIVAVKAAYEKGDSSISSDIPNSLIKKLGEFPIQSANRPLMKEEEFLRDTWIHLIYMILENLNHPVDGLEEDDSAKIIYDEDMKRKYLPYVTYITKWRKDQNYADRDAAAMIKDDLKVDDVLQELASSDEGSLTALEKSILPQSIRIMILTLVVLEEEKRCLDDNESPEQQQKQKKNVMPPQPPIPGTF